MQNNYPIIIYPDSLASVAEATPPLPAIPKEPIKPTLNEPRLPAKPSKPTSFANAWGCGLLTIVIFILIIYGARTTDFIGFIFENLPFPLNLIFIVPPIFGIYFIYTYHKNSEKERAEYESKIKQYEEDLRQYKYDKVNYKIEFEKNFKDYTNHIYPNYLKSLQIYEQEKKRILSNTNRIYYRKQMVKLFFNKTKRPVKINNQYLTGVSEGAFYQFLKSKSENFKKNYGIIEDVTSERYYVPDIIYFDETIGILIDIEIDEPYLGSDGSPIHYITYDDMRNKFFKENGWIVLRFAEFQVVKYPEQCFAFIMNFIRGMEIGELEINYSTLELIPQWSKDDAHKMAFNRFRNEYLGRTLIENIKNETIIESQQSNNSTNRIRDDLPF